MNGLSLPAAVAGRLRVGYWRVLVTGASGWLGQAALEVLARAMGPGWSERVIAFGSNQRRISLRDGSEVLQQALASLATLRRQPSILLHFAYLTREKATCMSPDAYTATNRALSRLAVEGGAAAGVERIFAVSSGAVHAALAAPSNPDPALLYGKLKLEDEALFEDFAFALPERRVFLARLFNLSGPYINKLDSYALASFIEQARGGRIHIRARHPVIRSYTSVSNLLGVALAQLLADDAGRFVRVETAGDREVELRDLAEAVRDEVAPHAAIERPPMAQAPIDRYVGEGEQYRRLLLEHGIAEHLLSRQIADTADYLECLKSA
jgi:nucleoside-diphosphate-sugar epimerase